MKARFDAQAGETRTVMVTAIHGVRPQPPRAGRSLEGYCILVSSGRSCKILFRGGFSVLCGSMLGVDARCNGTYRVDIMNEHLSSHL